MSSNVIEPPVRTAERAGVLVLIIDREQAGNSISRDTAQAMRDALDGTAGRTDLRGIVVTGAGDRFFCTGGDLKAYRAMSSPEELAETFGVVRGLLDDIESHPLPVIAAINGYALGGGAELALACDLRFAAEGAKIGLPQARLGIIPGWNGAERLMHVVGYARAMRMLLSCEQLSAKEALDQGLVDAVAADEDVVDHAVDFLAGMPAAPLAVSATKRTLRAAARGEGQATGEALLEDLWFSEDHREAEQAFAEKRAPAFKGR
jgi:enoyl-CoA hydratase